MTCGKDAAATHLSNAYWYLDTGDIQPREPSVKTLNATTNRRFILVGTDLAREGMSSSLVDYMVKYIVSLYLLSGISLQIRLTKARPRFYLM